MPHTDGPLYHNFVTIISLGSPVIFKFTRNNQTIQLLVEPQSLLVFTSEAYIEWLHGIEYYDEDSIFFNYENGSITNSNIVNFKESNLASLITVSDEKET